MYNLPFAFIIILAGLAGSHFGPRRYLPRFLLGATVGLVLVFIENLGARGFWRAFLVDIFDDTVLLIFFLSYGLGFYMGENTQARLGRERKTNPYDTDLRQAPNTKPQAQNKSTEINRSSELGASAGEIQVTTLVEPSTPAGHGPEHENTPFGNALLALYCDARTMEVKNELLAKYPLSDRQAMEVVQAAQDYIKMGYEARNPEAWKSLGLKKRL